MGETKKTQHLDEARALYREGLSIPQIAAALPVSASTLRRWLRAEAEAASPEPEEAAAPAEKLRRKLEERLERLVEESEADATDGKLEDRMLKLCRVLEFLRGEEDDVSAQLVAMKRFAAFCLRTLSEREMAPVRKATRLFVEKLKREHS